MTVKQIVWNHRLVAISMESYCYSWVNLISSCKVKIAEFEISECFSLWITSEFSFSLCLFGITAKFKLDLVYTALICYSALFPYLHMWNLAYCTGCDKYKSFKSNPICHSFDTDSHFQALIFWLSIFMKYKSAVKETTWESLWKVVNLVGEIRFH